MSFVRSFLNVKVLGLGSLKYTAHDVLIICIVGVPVVGRVVFSLQQV